MKVLVLNKKEEEALTKLLYNIVKQPGCSYEITTILEKLSTSEYEKAFDTNDTMAEW